MEAVSLEKFWQILREKMCWIGCYLADNPDWNLIRAIIKNRHYATNSAIALDEHTSPDVLQLLVEIHNTMPNNENETTNDTTIRYEVALNPNTDQALLKTLIQDKSRAVSGVAQERLVRTITF